MIDEILSHIEGKTHPLLAGLRSIGAVALCIITSDTGLCSNYNNNVIRSAEGFIKSRDKNKVKLITVGKEGFRHFRKHGYEVSRSYLELYGRFSAGISEKITSELTGMFLRNEVDEVFIAYTHFDSTLRHKPIVEKFLNIEHIGKSESDFLIMEPNEDRVLEELLPKYLSEKVRLMMLDSFTSEHAARMIAMKAATDNAKELIDKLTLLKNKARQAAITREVTEIAMSAEALKG